MPALSIREVPQVCDPDRYYQTRPPTRSRSTVPPRPNSRPSTVARPYTVGTTRSRNISTARTWYYGKPPPKEVHAPVIDWNKARQIKAPIIRRRARSSHACRKENVEKTEVSVLQPYPMNYNTFLVQSLKRDLENLYTAPQGMRVTSRPNTAKSTQGSSESSDDDVSIDSYWKMT